MMDYPTEQQAQERELARIYTQIAQENIELAQRIRRKYNPYYGLDELRAKLTSWPAMFSKRYEVARALALGWWYQLTVKEQRDIVDGAVTVFICVVVIAVFGWLSSH